MNIQLPIVLSDITGKSGQAIIQAILDGERDGHKLAALADKRVKASKATLTKALTGFWKDNHLFELQQHWEMYHFYTQQIKTVEEKIDALLQKQVEKTGQNDLAYQIQDKSEKQGKRSQKKSKTKECTQI